MKKISFFIALAFILFSGISFAQDSNPMMQTEMDVPEGLDGVDLSGVEQMMQTEMDVPEGLDGVDLSGVEQMMQTEMDVPEGLDGVDLSGVEQIMQTEMDVPEGLDGVDLPSEEQSFGTEPMAEDLGGLAVGSSQTSNFQDVPASASYSDSVNRLADFGIIRGDDRGMFRPDGDVTREQFVTMLVNSLGFESKALDWDGENFFYDVERSRWSSGFINFGFSKSFFSGIGNGQFAPLQDVTFGQAVTMLVRSRDVDVKEGTWPQNYIDKAKKLNITAGVSLRANEKAPRWAVAVMIDNILLSDLTSAVDMGADLTDASRDYIILGDSVTHPDLPSEQILTDKGVLTVPRELGKVEVGEKHRIASYGDRAIALFGRVRELKSVAIKDFDQNEITYIKEFRGEEKKLELTRGARYYYDGDQIEFEMLKDVVKSNSSIVFGITDTGYDYAVIVDPIYREPVVIRDQEISETRIGTIGIDEKTGIIRNGRSISPLDLRFRDVVYRVRDLNNFMQYIEVVDRKLEGEITEILPDKISPRVVSIEDTEVEIGRYLDRSKINMTQGSFNVEDKVSALLGYDGKIVDIEKLTTRTNEPVDVIIQANHLTDNSLGKDQVNTNIGVLNVSQIDDDLKLGLEYEVLVDENNIVRVDGKVTDVSYYTIESAFENVIRVKNEDQETGEILLEQKNLPSGIEYFYNGGNIVLTDVTSDMERNSTIAFAKNERGSGYQYAVVIDPVVFEPVILGRRDINNGNIGGVNVNDTDIEMVKGGEKLQLSDLKELDVAYVIADVENDFKYIEIVRERQEGEIIDISPSKASPQNLQIEGGAGAVELGRFFDINKIDTSKDAFDVGDFVSVLIGREERVVDILELTKRMGQEEEIIVQANSDTDSDLGKNQIETDVGVLNIASPSMKLEVGGMYKVLVDDAYIVDIKESRRKIEYVTVESSVGNIVRIRDKGSDGEDMISEYDLPNITYYYNGATFDSSGVKQNLSNNSTLAFAKRPGGGGYNYAVVIDPVYSKPAVTEGSRVSRDSTVGDVVFSDYTTILKNGDYANLSDIRYRDVVYEVSDYLGTTKYIEVYRRRERGRLTAISPNRLSPRAVEVGGISYTISKDANIEKISDPDKSVDIEDVVTLLRGKDGEVVEIR